ncbi:hypothetical protein JCM17380_16450 [Desulfosporosinus burensis]
MGMKKPYLITCAIAIIALVLSPIIITKLKQNACDSNSQSFKEQVSQVGQQVDTINLHGMTSFDWDVLYSFAPYTPKESIYQVIGFKSDNIQETISEGMNQLIFVKSGEVVCHLNGYPAKDGYGISFLSGDYTDGVVMLHSTDKINFKVTRNKGVIYLEHVK